MTDEHDPRYPLPDKKHNPDPEAYAREYEVREVQKEIARLKAEIEELREDEEDRLSTMEANLNEWSRRYSYGKGIVAGVIVVFGVFGIFVVDTVREVLNHVFTNNTHGP